jgi:hypothetical protein
MPQQKNKPTPAPVIEVEIGGQTRRLRWDLRARKAIERALPDVNALDGFHVFLAQMNATTMPIWVWAGLLWEEPELTLEQVEEWLLDMTGYEAISEAFAERHRKQLMAPPDAPADEENPTAAWTGSQSGPSVSTTSDSPTTSSGH